MTCVVLFKFILPNTSFTSRGAGCTAPLAAPCSRVSRVSLGCPPPREIPRSQATRIRSRGSRASIRRCARSTPSAVATSLQTSRQARHRAAGAAVSLCLARRAREGRAVGSEAPERIDDLREAVLKHEELERTARRVLGGAHPTTTGIEKDLRNARVLLAARETQSTRTSA